MKLGKCKTCGRSNVIIVAHGKCERCYQRVKQAQYRRALKAQQIFAERANKVTGRPIK